MGWDMQNTTLKTQSAEINFVWNTKQKDGLGYVEYNTKKFKVVKLILYGTQNKRMGWDMQNTTLKNLKW